MIGEIEKQEQGMLLARKREVRDGMRKADENEGSRWE